MSDNAMFQEAIQALQEGKKERARDLFTRLLRTNQNNAEYWLWLSAAVETPKERIYCLENVARLEPDNRAAQRGLILAGARQPGEDHQPSVPVRRKWTVAPAAEDEQPKTLIGKIMANPLLRLATLLTAIVIFIFLVGLGIATGVRSRNRPLILVQLSITPQMTIIASATPSLLPTNTVVVRSPTPTYLGPTPLWVFLEATYTPTPRYVDTPHPILESYRSSLWAYEHGDLNTFLTYIQQASREGPDSPDLFYYLGEAFYLLEQYKEALDAYNQALTIDPNFGPAYMGRARVMLAQDPGVDILADLEKALEIDPNIKEVYIIRAAYLIEQNKPDEALQDVKILSTFNLSDPQVYLLRAQALLLKEDYQKAMENAEKALDLDSTLLPAYLTAAQAQILNNKPQKALENALIYLRYAPENVQAWLILGEAYFLQGNSEKAIESFNQGLALNSNYGKGYWYRGQIYLAQGEGQNAANEFADALHLEPENFTYNLDMGRALLMAERFADAARQLASTRDLAETDAQLAAVYYWRAQALDASQSLTAAQREYELLLELPAQAVPAAWADFARARLLVLNPPTVTPTFTPSPSPTVTNSPTITLTPSPSSTAKATDTPPPATASPTRTPSPTSQP